MTVAAAAVHRAHSVVHSVVHSAVHSVVHRAHLAAVAYSYPIPAQWHHQAAAAVARRAHLAEHPEQLAESPVRQVAGVHPFQILAQPRHLMAAAGARQAHQAGACCFPIPVPRHRRTAAAVEPPAQQGVSPAHQAEGAHSFQLQAQWCRLLAAAAVHPAHLVAAERSFPTLAHR